MNSQPPPPRSPFVALQNRHFLFPVHFRTKQYNNFSSSLAPFSVHDTCTRTNILPHLFLISIFSSPPFLKEWISRRPSYFSFFSLDFWSNSSSNIECDRVFYPPPPPHTRKQPSNRERRRETGSRNVAKKNKGSFI